MVEQDNSQINQSCLTANSQIILCGDLATLDIISKYSTYSANEYFQF